MVALLPERPLWRTSRHALPTAAPSSSSAAAPRSCGRSHLEVRVLRTLRATILARIHWRNRPHGRLLAERGAELRTPAPAPAASGPP
jgi:hypothetical protein